MSESHELNPAHVTELAGLATYQDGAIVSRTLVNSNSGSLTLFAFDAGQRLSEHTAPFAALVQVIDGTAEIVIDGIAQAVTAGQVVLMPANIPHAVKAHERFKMLLTMFKAAKP